MMSSEEIRRESQYGTSGAPAKGEIKTRVKPMFDERKNRLASHLMDTADVLRETGSRMEQKKQLGGGEYARKAADRLADYSGYLQNNSVDTILRDVQHFSRERPWLIMGGAFILGATLARFMKASGES
jgi:hypothetical protein